jgi:predicted ATPase/class 3 adenylate cyclase
MQSDSGSAGPTGTVTFLFTDIEGSTQLLQRSGEAFPGILEAHTRLLQDVVERHGGRVVDRAGDGLFVVFDRAGGGLLATVEAQRALRDHMWPGDARVSVRMGLHTGDAVRSGSSYVGLDVHRAARIAAAAHGGQVIVSDVTRRLVAYELPADITFRDLGEHRLKDMPAPERLHQVLGGGLLESFPPLRTAGGLPGNLPARPARLIGRDRELEDLREMLIRDDVRLVTLTGPGGTGKTSLAVELAARSLRDFTDGIAWVPLASIDEPRLVFSVVAQTLGVATVATLTMQDAVFEHLRERRALLVLDNFEHVLDAAPELASLARVCPHVTLLVTSRFALNLSIEHEFAVAPLRTPDRTFTASAVALAAYPAVELFAQRAAAVRPGFGIDDDNAIAVARICSRLDGLPLAIELAAARIKVLPPRALLARLDRRLEVLSGGSRDMPARHRTLRHAIGWSYDLLDAGEQAVFRRLSVFAGGCSLEAADAVCAAAGEPAMSALDGVSALVDKSLLRQDPGVDGEPRFVMLETVREFAIEQLEASDEAAATRGAHADFFIRLGEEAAPELMGAGQSQCLDRLERDHDNLRAAFDWCVRTADAMRALRLGASLTRFWIIRAFHSEARERLRSALALPCSPALEPVRCRVLSGAAILAYEQNDLDEATALLQDALAYFRAAGERRATAETLNHLGWVAFFAGDIDRAETLSQEALSIHEERNDTRGIAVSLTNLGGTAQFRGEFGRSRALYERALDLRRSLNEARGIAYAMLNLGSTVRHIGDHDSALRLTQQGLEMVRRLGDKQLTMYGCAMLGTCALERGDAGAALAPLREASTLAREIHQSWTLGLSLGYEAEALALIGEIEQACALAAEAVESHEEGGVYLWRVISLTSRANVERMAGNRAMALKYYMDALDRAQSHGMRFSVSRCAAGLASLASDAGVHEAAARLAGAARTLRTATGATASLVHEPDLDQLLNAARAAVGDVAAQRAFDDGAARAFEDVSDLLPKESLT